MAQQLGLKQQRAQSSGISIRSLPHRLSAPRPVLSSSHCCSRGNVQVCLAGKLDDVSLFADSSMLGPGSSASTSAAVAGGVETVVLKSKVCLDAMEPCGACNCLDLNVCWRPGHQ
jgi:hypothetical protein